MNEDIIIYANGFIYCAVCVPADFSIEEVEALTNAKNPTGSDTLTWKKSTNEKFHSGQTNPCPCEQNTSRKHWLMSC